MTTVNDVLQTLERFAPLTYAESWDNPGLLVGSGKQFVKKVLVCLDASMPVIIEAVRLGANLIVSHHPVIFSPVKNILDSTPNGKTLIALIKNDISVISMHTNMDSAYGGVSDALAEAIGLSETRPLETAGMDEQGNEYGTGRLGCTEARSASGYAELIKAKLGCNGVRYYDSGNPVRFAAVIGGSGGSYLHAVIDAGCDTLVTADVKHDTFIDCASFGINLIDAGHFPTEKLICPVMAKSIMQDYPELEVILSENDIELVTFLAN